MQRNNGELFAIRPWHLRWGATDLEITEAFPGDEIMPDAGNQVTQAITIESSPEEVWKGLVRIGRPSKRSGGDTLTGFEVEGNEPESANARVLEVGDHIRCVHIGWLDGEYRDVAGWHVAMVDPHKALVLLEEHQRGTWAFILKHTDDGHTRLLIRVRGNKPADFGSGLFNYGVFEPAHFILERNIMLALKDLAEGGRESPLVVTSA